jgi:hypothetical protein
MRNYSVSQNLFAKYFLHRKMKGGLNPIAIGSQGVAVLTQRGKVIFLQAHSRKKQHHN